MDELHPTTAHTRTAIDCLRRWMDEDRLGAAMYIARVKYGLKHRPDGPDEDAIMVGLLNLSHILVLELAKKRGAAIAEDLEKRVHDILTDLSLQLPD